MALVIAATGCGTGGDGAQVRRAASRFLAAYARHDGAVACAQLSPSLRQQLVKDQSEPRCARAVLGLGLHRGAVGRARVYATSAVVETSSGDTLFFGSGQTGWRIEALGCRRQGPGPLQCEEQS